MVNKFFARVLVQVITSFGKSAFQAYKRVIKGYKIFELKKKK